MPGLGGRTGESRGGGRGEGRKEDGVNYDEIGKGKKGRRRNNPLELFNMATMSEAVSNSIVSLGDDDDERSREGSVRECLEER